MGKQGELIAQPELEYPIADAVIPSLGGFPGDISAAGFEGTSGVPRADHSHRGVRSIECEGINLFGDVELVFDEGLSVIVSEDDRLITVDVDTDALGALYVNVLGDIMTGNLTMDGGNIVMVGAETVDGRDVSADGADLDELYTTIGLSALTAAEVDQLENIGAVTISNVQWGYLGALDQALTQASSPTFNALRANGSIIVAGTVDGVDVADHSARHEDTGADEISVAGLSGLLADGQTPLAHALPGAHTFAGLTIGHVLRASGAAAAGFAAIQAGDLPAAIDAANIGDGSVSNAEFELLDDYNTIGLAALTAGEVDQLENIGATTISAAQWGYLGAMDQGVATGSAPTFSGLTSGSIHSTSTHRIDGACTMRSTLEFVDPGIGTPGAVLYPDYGDDELRLGVESHLGRMLVLTELSWRTLDHGHAVQVDPAFFVHSATSPAVANTQWIGFLHNKTHGVIETGLGDLYLNPASFVRFGTHAAIGAEAVTGYITINDAAGNPRKLAVVS